MPKRFSFEAKSNRTGEAESFDVEFSDGEWSLIQEFAQRVDHLSEASLVRRGLWGDLRLMSGHDNPLKPDPEALKERRLLFTSGTITADTSEFPGREELDALLYRLRPIILKSEPTFFPRILNLFSRKAKHPFWEPLRERFNGQRSTMRLQHIHNGVKREVLSAESLKDWLHAFEYHHDPHLASAFREIPAEFVTPEAVQALMLEFLAEKTLAALELRRFIRSLEKGSGTFRHGEASQPDGH